MTSPQQQIQAFLDQIKECRAIDFPVFASTALPRAGEALAFALSKAQEMLNYRYPNGHKPYKLKIYVSDVEKVITEIAAILSGEKGER